MGARSDRHNSIGPAAGHRRCRASPGETAIHTPHASTDLRARADAIGRWWHSIDLGHGVVTDGEKTPEILATEVSGLELPPLGGRTVLDIGAWDGFFSFEAERRGAARVVALDWFVWAIRWDAVADYLAACRRDGSTPRPLEEVPELWSTELPGKRGFDLAREVLGSHVEAVAADFLSIDPGTVGRFDVVLFLGVVYHQRHPLRALERLRAFTKDLAVIESHAAAYPGFEHLALCEFLEAGELEGDYTNWWSPNLNALIKLCRSAGFPWVEVVAGPPPDVANLPAGSAPVPYRAIVHAHV